MSESALECYAVKQAEDKYSMIVHKLYNPSNSGWPDRIFLSPFGAHFYIEFKDLNEEPRKLQKVRIYQLCEIGAWVYVVDNKQEADRVLQFEARSRMGTPPVSRACSEDYDPARWGRTTP